ncbi:MAG: Gldg family protein [Candidatus Omnitrophica bacterium]|nr:Gldg family protein [Candidatus Omnitrophota bacterium]
MNKIIAIAKKELSVYFKSPIAYIILILTIAIFNIFFYMIIDQNKEVALKDVFQVMEFMFIFLVPLLTMGAFAQEKASGTMEFLMTAPVTNTAIVIGKYLGALVFFSSLIGMTFMYYGIVEYFGTPDRMTILTGYLGVWLEGAFFLGVGMLTSCWTGNQVIAAISSYAILFLMYFSSNFLQYFTGAVKVMIQALGTGGHLENLAVGIITVSDVVYYISGILICLFLTRLSIENRLWQFKKAAVVFLCVLVSCCLWFGINYFTYLLPWQWDVTRAKQHTLSAGTIDVVKNLNRDVKVTAFYAGIPPKYLEDLFKEYTKVSHGKISTEIIDPIKEIGYAAQFGNVINVKEHKVFVSSGGQQKEIYFTDSPLSQEQLTNAIVRVNQSKRRVYFLTGHGELNIESKDDQGLNILARLLDSNNFESRSLMLAVAREIPKDCSVLIIAGPKNDLTKQEDEIIENYLEKGGRALFLVENVIVTTPDKTLTPEELGKNPSLNEILNQWGLNVESDVVVDLASHAGEDVGSPATKNYGQNQVITEGLDYTFYVRPRSITVLKDYRSTIKLAPLVLTASKKESWGESDRTLRVHFDENKDIPGPVAIAYLAFKAKEKGDRADTRLVVFTDADFLSNVYIHYYSNAQMGLKVINWLAETDYKVFVDQEKIKVERLDLTSKQKYIIAIVLFLMPVFIALAGIIVWLKSKI